jgi:hypothetical protein
MLAGIMVDPNALLVRQNFTESSIRPDSLLDFRGDLRRTSVRRNLESVSLHLHGPDDFIVDGGYMSDHLSLPEHLGG